MKIYIYALIAAAIQFFEIGFMKIGHALEGA